MERCKETFAADAKPPKGYVHKAGATPFFKCNKIDRLKCENLAKEQALIRTINGGEGARFKKTDCQTDSGGQQCRYVENSCKMEKGGGLVMVKNSRAIQETRDFSGNSRTDTARLYVRYLKVSE